MTEPTLTNRNMFIAFCKESKLKIENQYFNSPSLPATLEQLDMHIIMNGKKADIELFKMKLGQSDLSLTGYLSDFPAVVHHTNIPVTAHLEIVSDVLDIAELTNYSEKAFWGAHEAAFIRLHKSHPNATRLRSTGSCKTIFSKFVEFL